MKTYTKTLLILLIFSLVGGTVCKAATVNVSLAESAINAFRNTEKTNWYRLKNSHC
jgi:hypothetical protein